MASEVLPVSQAPMLASHQQSQSPIDAGERILKPVQKNQSSLDSLKMLEPGRKKLSSVETQRVVAVLDETIKKLELVSLFQHAIENMERYSIVFGSELTGALREHQRLQVNMQRQLSHLNKEVMEDKEQHGSLWGKTDMSDTARINLTVQGVQSSVRNIMRLFLANPTASKALRSEGHIRDQTFQTLIQSLSELRGFLFEMLLTSPLEQKERIHFLQKITLRDHKNREALSALEEELNAAILDRDTEIAKKNEVIRQLKISLHQLEKISESQVRRTVQESEKQQKSDRRASEGKCLKFQQDLQQLRSQLNGAIAENREVELSLRKKKYKVETEIENWIQKYDGDMREKQTELEELEAVYEEEKAQLEELKEKLAVLEVEYVQIMEERHQAQLKKEAAEKELAIKNRAATIIQSLWKGYQVRKTMKSKKKKKKKKGKGASGKGKGKGKGKKGKK
ncbi:PREDICTED: IQ domain-containing protein D [Nanorana parkeri]|uniref:IQ domain-containing protein D n=1 Tax=Nanorana parkeri TaxID=125878 RepID=UPI000854BC97|nr:PREDICTED: IQ domain-containing protein D [Nanorana parkeri]